MKRFFAISFLIIAITACTELNAAPVWSEVFQQVRDKVVQVIAYGSPFDWQEPYKKGDLTGARGTGFILAGDDGTLDIYTNFHVIDGADVLYIQFPALGKERFEAHFIGGSPDYDWARLRLTADAQDKVYEELRNLKAANLIESDEYEGLLLADSDELKQGSDVMLVGYPFGDENVTITAGAITGEQPTPWGTCLTISAASSPGSSGGPVFNAHGMIIGILVGGRTDSDATNYVLPISRLKTIMDQLKDGNIVQMPYWGLQINPATPTTLASFGLDGDAGAYIAAIKPGSLAEKAGLLKGDIITKINGHKVDHFAYVRAPWTKYKVEYHDVLARIKTGTEATFDIYRNGESVICSVIVDTCSPHKIKRYYLPFHDAPAYDVFGGMVIMEITKNHINAMMPSLAHLLKQNEDSQMINFLQPQAYQSPKLLITYVFPETELARNRVFSQLDNLISKVNGREVATIEQLRSAVLDGKESGVVTLESQSGAFVVLRLADILSHEQMLSEKYKYPLSPLIEKLVLEA